MEPMEDRSGPRTRRARPAANGAGALGPTGGTAAFTAGAQGRMPAGAAIRDRENLGTGLGGGRGVMAGTPGVPTETTETTPWQTASREIQIGTRRYGPY